MLLTTDPPFPSPSDCYLKQSLEYLLTADLIIAIEVIPIAMISKPLFTLLSLFTAGCASFCSVLRTCSSQACSVWVKRFLDTTLKVKEIRVGEEEAVFILLQGVPKLMVTLDVPYPILHSARRA